MSVQIPTGDGATPFFSVRAPLDGATYVLEFRWNVRANKWFMALFNEDRTIAHMVGVAVVADWFFGSYELNDGPPGAFRAVDTSGQGIDPGLADLGDRVQIRYYSRADLAKV